MMTVMGSDTEYLPDEITYGFVADRVLLAIGDTTGDDDRFPDGVPAKGTVKFSPERTILYTQETPATVLPQDIECTIYHRDHPVAVNNWGEPEYEPELVGKLVDPAGHVGNVALIVGWYEAVYRLETGTAQRFRFQVRPEHTADNPLWLPEVAPLSPTPSERFVVNEQVYNDTKEARDEAVGAAGAAVEARTGAETARDQAGTHATASAASASTAADILAASQALGITVDTSVGTRVFVGDTMIYGDTGWRDVTSLITPTPTFGTMRIRRYGDVVEVVTDSLSVPTSGSVVLATLPNGFRPQGNKSFRSFAYWASDTEEVGRIAFDGRFQFRLLSSGNQFTVTVVYTSRNTWPTTLPGTPA